MEAGSTVDRVDTHTVAGCRTFQVLIGNRLYGGNTFASFFLVLAQCDQLLQYGHLSKFRARVGQKVKRGEVIGEVGNTGKSTGPHLHYEVIVRGKYDNPSKYYYMDLTPEEYDRMIQIAENHGQVMD